MITLDELRPHLHRFALFVNSQWARLKSSADASAPAPQLINVPKMESEVERIQRKYPTSVKLATVYASVKVS